MTFFWLITVIFLIVAWAKIYNWWHQIEEDEKDQKKEVQREEGGD